MIARYNHSISTQRNRQGSLSEQPTALQGTKFEFYFLLAHFWVGWSIRYNHGPLICSFAQALSHCSNIQSDAFLGGQSLCLFSIRITRDSNIGTEVILFENFWPSCMLIKIRLVVKSKTCSYFMVVPLFALEQNSMILLDQQRPSRTDG